MFRVESSYLDQLVREGQFAVLYLVGVEFEGEKLSYDLNVCFAMYIHPCVRVLRIFFRNINNSDVRLSQDFL